MLRILFLMAFMVLPIAQAQAFCGFFVAKADTDLFNEASKVVIARAENRTVMTMANDFQGDLKEFAIVIPVSEVPQESQINVAENRIIDHLDAYTSPRLVKYNDPDPCMPYGLMEDSVMMRGATASALGSFEEKSAAALGVTIEAEYTVGEYDIVILSAKQSDGLLTYMNQEGYKLPDGAEKVLGSYIKQDMKFFLAKVNLEEQAKSGYTFLRPLQVAFESEKFMLPIRLGTLNANGPQDLILFTLTQKGRVEAANYRTTKIPSDTNIPVFVGNNFGEFYKAMFSTAVEKENMKTVMLEYAWDMGWCDPCAADPVSNDDLQTLGVWWLNQSKPVQGRGRGFMPQPAPANTFVTRLHMRYTAESFPEDLMLMETADRQNFQGRYVMQIPFEGDMDCEAGTQYLQSLPPRFETEAQNLSNLTGWKVADIKKRMEDNGQKFDAKIPTPKPWWEKLWKK